MCEFILLMQIECHVMQLWSENITFSARAPSNRISIGSGLSSCSINSAWKRKETKRKTVQHTDSSAINKVHQKVEIMVLIIEPIVEQPTQPLLVPNRVFKEMRKESVLVLYAVTRLDSTKKV